MRRRQARLLLGVFARTAGWRPVLPMAAICFGLLAWADWRDHGGAMLWLLRGAALLLAIGATFAVEDAAGTLTSASPTRLGIRRAVPVGAVLAGVAAVWAGLLGYAATFSSAAIPVGHLTLELATLLALGWSLAAVFGPLGAGPALLALVMASARLPGRWSLLGGAPGDADWAAAHQRWLGLLLVAVAALVVTARDPAARSRVRT